MIELTVEQQRTLDAADGAPVVIDPRTGDRYVLVPRTAREPLPQSPSVESDAAEIPEGILRSRAALRRDLPELLGRRRNRGKLVCYHRDERIGISHDYAGLIRECVHRNIPDDEFIIEIIAPGAGNEEEEDIETPFV